MSFSFLSGAKDFLAGEELDRLKIRIGREVSDIVRENPSNTALGWQRREFLLNRLKTRLHRAVEIGYESERERQLLKRFIDKTIYDKYGEELGARGMDARPTPPSSPRGDDDEGGAPPPPAVPSGSGLSGGRIGRREPFNFIRTGQEFINNNQDRLRTLFLNAYYSYFPHDFNGFLTFLGEGGNEFFEDLSDYILQKLEMEPEEVQNRIKEEYDFRMFDMEMEDGSIEERGFFGAVLDMTTDIQNTFLLVSRNIIEDFIKNWYINYYGDNPDIRIADRFDDRRAEDLEGINYNLNFTEADIEEIERLRMRQRPARERLGAVAEDPRELPVIPEESLSSGSESDIEGSGKKKLSGGCMCGCPVELLKRIKYEGITNL